MSTVFNRFDKNLTLSLYGTQADTLESLDLGEHFLTPPDHRQYILRMALRFDGSELMIPPELEWMRETIEKCCEFQKTHFTYHPFVYLTVRSGEVTSKTDDVWHVDGFSMRYPHVPEQNYIWSNNFPTQVSTTNTPVPSDFDPMKHNLHNFFDSRQTDYVTVKPNHIYVIDPYVVHRRDPASAGHVRSFFRLSFVPIAIESDDNTQNPLLPVKQWNRADIREKLINY
jgi:hypothetical protein